MGIARFLVSSIVIGTLCMPVPGRSDETPAALVEKLMDISEPGTGYSPTFTGSEFLPFTDSAKPQMGLVGAMGGTPSETLRKLVEQGADAVPTLLAHLADERPTKAEPGKAMMWMGYPDEYDFNQRTAKSAPPGVNREMSSGISDDDPWEHSLTVGDLAFVALGQIVNRNYSAMRYQPTGGLVVNSPSYSKRLRQAVLDEWSGLTREKHRAGLIDDFRRPDHMGRRLGAYLRLAYYYPTDVEPLVLEALAEPTVNAKAAQDLCRKTLYKAAHDERNPAYQAFLRKHGAHQAAAVESQLFDDLGSIETLASGGSVYPPPDFSDQPRQLLVELFGRPTGVKSDDRPKFNPTTEYDLAYFLGGLVHDHSPKIAARVKDLFVADSDDPQISAACLKCLANRGDDEFLAAQIAALEPTKLNKARTDWIAALSKSKSPRVRDALLELLRRTTLEPYLMAAVPAVDSEHDKLLLESIKRVLAALPAETAEGLETLYLVRQRFPDEARAVLASFGRPKTAGRAETLCRVLWQGGPLATELLGPLLSDERRLPNRYRDLRICDWAAQAISNGAPNVPFDADQPKDVRDFQLKKVVEYYRSQVKDST